MDYCSIIWGQGRRFNAERVTKLQKRAARLILKADFNTPSRVMFNTLNWMSFRDRVEYHTCVTVYKALNNQTPVYITDLLSKVSNNHTQQLRSQSQNLLHIPRSRSALYDNSFSICGPIAWNKLPNDIKSSNSLNSFKNSLTKHILTRAYSANNN